mmetsp:Transcript_69997/g.138654  ORF Transcript_69997/g.138654 Transcript_69997/m.138654 type:complete len:351 (-) Transcript_69997:200-1252(-)
MRTRHLPSAESNSSNWPSFPFSSGLLRKPSTETLMPGCSLVTGCNSDTTPARPSPSAWGVKTSVAAVASAAAALVAASATPAAPSAAEPATSVAPTHSLTLPGRSSKPEPLSIITRHLPSAVSNSSNSPSCPFNSGLASSPWTWTRVPACNGLLTATSAEAAVTVGATEAAWISAATGAAAANGGAPIPAPASPALLMAGDGSRAASTPSLWPTPSCNTARLEALRRRPEPSSISTRHRSSAVSNSSNLPSLPFNSGLMRKPFTRMHVPGRSKSAWASSMTFVSSQGADAAAIFGATQPGAGEGGALMMLMGFRNTLMPLSRTTRHLPSGWSNSRSCPRRPFRSGRDCTL